MFGYLDIWSMVKNDFYVASPLWDSVWCSPAVFFFSRINTSLVFCILKQRLSNSTWTSFDGTTLARRRDGKVSVSDFNMATNWRPRGSKNYIEHGLGWIQPLDNRRTKFGKHVRMCPGGECAECVVKTCLTWSFECAVNDFCTTFKSDAFQSASMWLRPVQYCSARIEETLF